uniref:PD-(D/E)XK endonuclease-like domain-containing protein n=2 Tax=Thermorudis TaxID=1649508 RepID=A0A7C3AQN7_9BACT
MIERIPRVKARRVSIGGTRFYEVEGVYYVSVTSVLQVVGKPELVRWAKAVALDAVASALSGRDAFTRDELEAALLSARSEPERQRDEAAARGSALHRELASSLRAHPAAARVLERLALTPLAYEVTLVSRRYGFAGTCDLVAEDAGGTLALVDWKSGSVWPEHALQAGAYAVALDEMTGETISSGYVVSLANDEPEVYAVDLDAAGDGFLAALGLFRALKTESLLERFGGGR